jgi:hypothetical protein
MRKPSQKGKATRLRLASFAYNRWPPHCPIYLPERRDAAKTMRKQTFLLARLSVSGSGIPLAKERGVILLPVELKN